MSNFVTSLTRTYAPIIIGGLVSWLATLGLQLDSETTAALVIAFTGFIQALYYTVVRLLEKKWPKLGILLGKATTPDYK